MSACGSSKPGDEVLSKLVGEAVLSGNSNAYYEGECCGEGHKILGCDVSGNRLKVYALTMFGNYGFQNEKFIKISGSGVIPAVLFDSSMSALPIIQKQNSVSVGLFTH